MTLFERMGVSKYKSSGRLSYNESFFMLSEHRSLSTLAQAAKQVFWRYSTYVACFVEIPGGRWSIALVLTPVALDENTGYNNQEYGAKSAGKGNEDDKADSHIPV